MALSINAWQTLTWSVRSYCSCPVGYLREALSVAAQTNTKTDPFVGKHLKKVKTILFQNKTCRKPRLMEVVKRIARDRIAGSVSKR